MRKYKKVVGFELISTNDSDVDLDLESVVGKSDCQVLSMHVAYTSTATANNRFLQITTADAAGVTMGHLHPGSYQPPSKVYHYYFLPGIFRETVSAVAETGVDGTIQVPIPRELIVPLGGTLNLKDAEAVDAAADDMVIHASLGVLR
jgi:hypothetical protein